MAIRNPNGHDVYNLRQTNEGSHNFITTLLGDYSFCFDNSFSAISTKEVNFNFKLYAVGRLRRRLGSDIDGNENDATTPDELNNLSQTLEKLSDNIGEVRELQMYLKAREMVHRNTSESTNSRVLWWSIFATVLIGSASVAQITYLRKIFANKRKV
ncbi:transmembrane emp24 domain-containing protein [Anaeramoeba flamelloides]|uniref:Transmembrane emp24 domain-containing protein n=1 Tax=Anaeramoeba flamelloides TaxID=1746091 RepID=A0ABQ8X917_9EUKA|nr:transmembrane emp24 domain-containing protein [Anaeramoeba flamelloides]